MAQVLDVYEHDYNPHRPVICFDERPCQLLNEVVMPLAMEPGKIQRQDYHYERNGTCVVMMALEPLAGQRTLLYETFEAQEAFELSQRFDCVCTPKKARWLNMAEIELSALSKQCLDRRIGDMKSLAKEVRPWARERHRKKTRISWQFTKNKVRDKFSRFYATLNN